VPVAVTAMVGVRPVITARAISVSSTTPSERAMMPRERMWRCQTAGSSVGRLVDENATGWARLVGGARWGWGGCDGRSSGSRVGLTGGAGVGGDQVVAGAQESDRAAGGG